RPCRGADGALGRARRADVRAPRSRRPRTQAFHRLRARRQDARRAQRGGRSRAWLTGSRARWATAARCGRSLQSPPTRARGPGARHAPAPPATAALGRALTGALLLASTIKRDERLSLEFSGDGPLRGVLVDATPDGDARGYVLRPATHLPPRAGKLDVGGALGRGVLCVMRVPLADGALYRSVVPLESGEIGADLAGYLLASEQTRAAVGVGVFVDTDGRVVAAGGYLVQALPGAADQALDAVAARIERV